jgi:hypothetical protein
LLLPLDGHDKYKHPGDRHEERAEASHTKRSSTAVRFAIALRFAADARFARKGTREDFYEIWSLAGERATTCAFNPESFSKDAQRYSVSGHVVVQSSKRFHCPNYGLKLHGPWWKIVSVSEDICYFCFARVGRGKKETVPKTD